MQVKLAAKIAKDYVTDLLADENIANLGLEEVVYNEEEQAWNITLGFSRPWNSSRNAITTITGEPAIRRAYRVVKVRDADGQVLSFTKRENLD
ncbi:hypothetical protein [Aurantimonas sp. VKM B-3413]|uniref:hypothetical protein n=1 Tax=Aurantimonas sp. VKM B-3413 TaxID=2779401 RepID=UPI001E56D352|nr:hypothetical protein [Aurantimonas sp. VKM B-3413]MCB8838239.1 hypothetical protein [Aurantimonas sp. VKM B-3413]